MPPGALLLIDIVGIWKGCAGGGWVVAMLAYLYVSVVTALVGRSGFVETRGGIGQVGGSAIFRDGGFIED